jgi:outer membrane protein OmpA-like peptidoglycan-associated protein
MTRILFSSFLLLLATVCLSGQSNNLNAFNALSARVLAVDHEIPNEDLTDLSYTFALELGYRRQLGKYFGLAVPLKIGLIDVGELENISIVGIELLGQFYPAGVNAKVSPYLHAGYGIVGEGFDDSNLQLPLGLGFNFKLGDNSWFNLQGEYRISNQENRDNIMAGVGYVYRFSSVDTDKDGIVNRDDRCPNLPGPAATGGCPDTDMDGIIDSDDKCPTEVGSIEMNGCPDADEDGVTDGEDACPEVAGPAATKGCPDQDGDGVTDDKDQCPDVAGPADKMGCPDTDGDGVPDHEDICPNVAGNPTTSGCPDRDGDGISDSEDQCPDAEGEEKAGGCPDRDNDGTPDKDDACPELAGTLKGCPDTDGDGVADRIDRCPTQPGDVANAGCPEIKQEVKERLEYAARAVQFETGSAKLKESSYVILSEIAGIMRQYPDYYLSISGHTDNVGSDVTNLNLSQRRASSCRDFLIATGIREARISSTGYGESRPTAENSTAEGRRLNRRVEFVLSPR